MALITWTDQLSVGILEFDTQHKRLVNMVNGLHDAMSKGQGSAVLGKLLDDLATYTVTHFAAEEKLMIAKNYPDYTAHKSEHDDLIVKVKELQAKLKSGQTMIGIETLRFLQSWLTNHILGTDKKYSAHLK